VLVDQSGKVEETSRCTVLAFSNGRDYSIKITSRTKRQLQEMFRRRGQGRLYIDRTFSALLFLLLRDFLTRNDVVVIDLEYDGHDRLIKDILSEMFGSNLPEIRFETLGDGSQAHALANKVFKGKKLPEKIFTLSEVSKLALRNQKRPRSLD